MDTTAASTTTPPDLEQFLDELYRRHQGHATRAETEAFLELWSHAPDASIMAAVGGHHVGYDQVAQLLTWVSSKVTFDSVESHVLVTHAHGDLAFTVALEDYKNADREPRAVTLRATQVYRREAARWRLVHRHAEALTPVAEL